MSFSFQNRPSLVAYVTCGDPDIETTFNIVLAAIDAGADIIELGVPFSDPVADGSVIQRASERALHQGTTLADVVTLGKRIRQKSSVGLIVFSYFNPIMRMGIRRFVLAAQEAGIDGVLAIDLPMEEAGMYLSAMRDRNLATVFLAAPTSTDTRLKQIAKASSGFIYAVSRTGVTGAQQQLPDDAEKLVQRLRKYTKLPIAVGFGISNARQVARVGQFADAAVVGSAIVETIERNPGREAQSVAQFIRSLVNRSSRPDSQE